MDSLWVYGDFDWLNEPKLIGLLGLESLDGSFSFEFDRDWLRAYGSIVFNADLKNYTGRQFSMPRMGLFGCFSDLFPDRWGRTLFVRWEQVNAKLEKRPVRKLNSFDYLIGLDDHCRMGGFRFKWNLEGPFLNDDKGCPIPPLTSIRALTEAATAIERSEERNQLPQIDCLQQLFRPGSSLGGARPKATLADENGHLFVAKFPSIKDDYDVALWEHIMHKLAKRVGIDVADTGVIDSGGPYHVLLSRRFDRTPEGKRVHFSSAMTQLGLTDGQNTDTGHGYLDIVEFIISGCHNVSKNQQELFRRVAFNIAVGNTDDHFRNHGFLLTQKGWTLSPAYDLNPTHNAYQSLLINETTSESSLDILLDSAEDYLLERPAAEKIIQEVRSGLADWRLIARQYGASKREMDYFTPVLDKNKRIEQQIVPSRSRGHRR